jgi:hypothetical protein
MSQKETREKTESPQTPKKENIQVEANLTKVALHDDDAGLGSRRYWMECVVTIPSTEWINIDVGELVTKRPISCLIRPKSPDITDAAIAYGSLSFSPAQRGPDGDYLTQNEFGMLLVLPDSEFRRFWDYQFGRWKPKVSARLKLRGHLKREHPVLARLTWKTQDYTEEGHAYLKILSVDLDYEFS